MSMSELLRPFGFGVTKYRVMNVTKNKDKGSVAFYIDARDVMDRLDEVVGGENWQDKYTVLAFSESRWAVECTLIVNGVAKTDVGEGDAPKDAYSDALKRAAVKFGIGRYLYDMDTGNWFPIDEWKNFTPESKKQIDELLRRNLSRLGVESQPHALRKEDGTSTTNPTAQAAPNGTTTGKASANGSSPAKGDDERAHAMRKLHAVGTDLYGTAKEWDVKRPEIVAAVTKNRATSSNDLTDKELSDLTAILQKRLDAKRAELDGITVNGTPEMAH